MVSLVLVSHSRSLAEATLSLVKAMTGEDVSIAIAAGTGDNHTEFGTDAMEILNAVMSVDNEDGVLIMMDMGSAILSAETALEFMEEATRARTHLCGAPFVEGTVAAAVAAKIGRPLKEVEAEAYAALKQKTEHLGYDTGETSPKESAVSREGDSFENAPSVTVDIKIPHGLHARPVANLIQEASKYKSNIRIKNLTNGKGPASIKSMTGVISLEALYGNQILLEAKGEDAQQALDDLKKAIESGLGDKLEMDNAQPLKKEEKENQNIVSTQKPIGVSEGIAIGKVFYPPATSFEVPENTVEDAEKEIERLNGAIKEAVNDLKEKIALPSSLINNEQRGIYNAHIAIINDPELKQKAEAVIRDEHKNAAFAWHTAVSSSVEDFQKLNDENLRQRIADLKDVDNVILQGLGVEINNRIELPEEGIVVVRDITPGQVSELDTTKVKGVICLENGPTSHSSILLKSRGIPAVIQAQYNAESLENLSPATLLILNGETGEIWVNPTEEKRKELTDLQQQYIKEQIENKRESLKPAFTLDNKEIKVYANIGRQEDSETAVENGADGSGLLRTEFMFLDRQQAPSEEEQIEILRQLLTPLKGKPVIIRTLDAGGDKNIPYLNLPKEDNPYLGIRAIRLCLMRPDLFLEQLKAILRIGAEFKDIKVMFPFISQLRELQEAKQYLNQAHEMLVKEGKEHLWSIETGMMMEIPSAAIMAENYMDEIDFLSIGTNDLIQYTMAADRGNPALAEYAGKELDDAVLKLIAHIVEEANKKNVSVSVCGEAASVPVAAAKLIGLGINSLSMSVYAIPAMKKWIREQNQSELQKDTFEYLHMQ